MEIDLMRQRNERVPATPLPKSSQVLFPLRDPLRHEMIGQRMSPPIRKRKRAIPVAGKEGESDLRRISVREKTKAARIISQ